MNWPARWGFILNLNSCIGKTIARVETLFMEYGASYNQCTLIEFTDGSRAYVGGRADSRGIMVGPSFEEMKKSSIIKPEEIGQVAEEDHRKKLLRRQEILAQKRRDLERLQKELREEG